MPFALHFADSDLVAFYEVLNVLITRFIDRRKFVASRPRTGCIVRRVFEKPRSRIGLEHRWLLHGCAVYCVFALPARMRVFIEASVQFCLPGKPSRFG